MYTLLKSIQVRATLLQKNIRIFTPIEFSHIFELSPDKAKYILEKQTRQGLITRLKKGLYVLKTDMPGQEEIANALYKPSYISFEYALAYHSILPEMTYEVTSATTKPTREFVVNNTTYPYYTIKRQAYTGYVLREIDSRTIQIAEAEKAFVDYLYFVVLGKRTLNDRLRVHKLDHTKVKKYASLFEKPKMRALLKTYAIT